jgi:hypothetical protein
MYLFNLLKNDPNVENKKNLSKKFKGKNNFQQGNTLNSW